MNTDSFGRTTVQRDGSLAIPLLQRERLLRPRLVWTDARGAHEWRVDERGVLGAAPHANVVVADRSVSRIHAEVEPTPSGLWVRDLGSKNGTLVDGLLVSAALVPNGGTITIGDTSIIVAYGEVTTEEEIWSAPRYGALLGRSIVMRKLFARIDALARTNLSVLIRGETGTGKELVARALHEASTRSAFELGVIDCAAMPETLLEAELFGHRRGAFTGADATREGLVERCDGGTLFLDEIGELPLSLQPKLLRLLEEKSFRRLGESRFRRVDVRFLAATHRDLRKMVNAGTFREDLYFRLAVATVEVPALRDRPEDIDLLVDSFMGAVAGSTLVSPFALKRRCEGRAFRGNVRELKSFIERAIALGTDDPDADVVTEPSEPRGPAEKGPLEAPPLPAVLTDVPFKQVRDQWVEHLEREYLSALLREHDRNVTAVARAAGLDRTYIHRLIRKHGL